MDDPELGRVVQPWTGDQVAAAWAETLRFGPDRIDRIVDSLDKVGTHSLQRGWLHALTLVRDQCDYCSIHVGYPLWVSVAAGILTASL